MEAVGSSWLSPSSNPMSPICILNSLGQIVTKVRPDVPPGWQPPEGHTAVPEDQLPPGTQWVPQPPQPVPTEVPLWAFRAALAMAGLKTSAEALIAALPEPNKTVATQQYEYGNFIERQHPLINGLGAQLGLTSAQIDEIFRLGASLL